MTRGENFIKKTQSKNGHCNSMSKSAWCYLNNKNKNFERCDKCLNPKC